MSEPIVKTLPLLVLKSGVVLPHMVVTIPLESQEAQAAANAADGEVLIVPQLEAGYARIGTVGQITETGNLPTGVPVIVVSGLGRATIGTGVAGTGDALWVQATEVVEAEPTDRDHELAREYRAVVENILDARGISHIAEGLKQITNPSHMADTSGYSPDLTSAQKTELLECIDVTARLQLALNWARETLANIELKEKIRHEVSDGMERTQREFLLRQQLVAIRKELGEGSDAESAVDEYRTKLESMTMPDAVRASVVRELDKLERTSEQNPEYGWIRSWLDTLLDLPWGVTTDDRLEVNEARAILDADHTGLEEPKDRIVEYLAVRKLRSDRGLEMVSGRGSGAIIVLVGPPGVGKTSLGESVARALGRKFVRISLGGIRDEAEIRGHRRTYVGAQAGRIARAIKEAGTMNPVLMLDEVDKLGADWRGDPSSALLEVLDPAQNHSFRDHYLEVDLDLSQVLFIATANVADTIPGPLLDRMEIIRLDGYTTDEKIAIARDHLLARQIERNGLRPGEVNITDDALQTIVIDHTREAGVRSLERALGTTLRKAATKIASNETDTPVEIDSGDIRAYLGRPKFFFESADRTSVPGVATGLAVTHTGGDVLFVEASTMDGSSGLTLTGQLGDVMRESAQIALSYIRSHASDLGIDPEAFNEKHFHLHVPAGAVPKDGPSAGVTMTTALTSLLTGRSVRSGVGMTGEVTLQGRVLAIGGVKQKVLAAHRAGLREVVLPSRNEADLDEVPEAVRAEMTFHLASDVNEVLAVALEQPAEGQAAAGAA